MLALGFRSERAASERDREGGEEWKRDCKCGISRETKTDSEKREGEKLSELAHGGVERSGSAERERERVGCSECHRGSSRSM